MAYEGTEPDGIPWRYRDKLVPTRLYSGIGKVVYKRKKHYFSINDIKRISDNYAARPIERKEEGLDLAAFIQAFTLKMLDKIAGIFSLEEVFRAVYFILLAILDWLFYRLPPQAKIENAVRMALGEITPVYKEDNN